MMVISVMVCLVCLAIATEDGPCRKTQHCAKCDRESGDCLTECETGYYDRKCNSTCSKNCRDKTCVLSETGNDNCTYGCIRGYQGIGCNIPCDSPGGSCKPCPGGCDGGYCQLGSSCVSGCVDSYYGTDCRNCSSGCTSCDRRTGSCDDKSGYEARLGLYVGLSAAAALSLTINLIVCCKSYQRSRKNSVSQTKEACNAVAVVDDASVAELEWYTDIPLTAMACESAAGNCAGEAAGVEDDVYDVVVERKRVFPGAVHVGNIYSKYHMFSEWDSHAKFQPKIVA